MNSNWPETGDTCLRGSVSGRAEGAVETTLERSDVPGGKPSPAVSSHAGIHAAELTEWVPLRSHAAIRHTPASRRRPALGTEGSTGWLALGALVGGLLAGRAAAAALLGPRAYNFHGRTVVITGGSRGLGLILARQFAAEGARLALLARDFGELASARDELSAAGAQVYAAPCDVRNRRDVEHAVANIVRRFGGIDVLINNAGIMAVGPMENMELADYEDAMATHYWGPYYMIQAALPSMRKEREARIVNIASFAGLIAVPHMAPYTASKFALVGLSDTLRAELAPHGIHVTMVAPGPMRTGSHVNATYKGQYADEYTWFAGSLRVPGLSTDSRRAARMIIEACRYGDPRLVIGLSTRVAVAIERMLPTFAVSLVSE